MRPTKNIKRFLAELKNLNLPTDQFAVFGGGVLAIRGIRECEDLDIIVPQDFLEELSRKYPVEQMDSNIRVHLSKNIEAVTAPFGEKLEVAEIIKTAEIFGGIRFEDLSRAIEDKRKLGRKKDLEDIRLIEEYLKDGGK